MKRNKFIDTLKSVFSLVEDKELEDETVIKMEDMITKDGATLRIKEDELLVGVEVFLVKLEDEIESEEVAPDGEYSFEDKVITILEGKVSEIVEVEQEEEVVEEEPKEPIAEVELSQEEVSETEKRLISIEKALSNLSEKMSSINELEKMVTKLSGLPNDEEIKLSKTESNKKVPNAKLNDREQALNFFSKRK